MTVDDVARRQAPATPAPGTWAVDPAATTASFSVRNFGVRRVHGMVTVTAGSVTVDEAGLPVRVTAVADLTTLTTGSARRDADLAGRSFFDVEHHPELPLVAHRVERAGDGWQARCAVGVRGVQAPLTLDVQVEEPGPDPGGPWRLVATGTLDLRTTPIRAPRALVGRFVAVRVETVLSRRAGDRDER